MKRKKKRHPVWDVYDEYRNTLFQIRSHANRIERLTRFNRWTEISLAVFTPSSAVTSFLFWNTSFGRLSWNVLVTAASVIAITKPLLKTDQEIKVLTHSLGGYTRLHHELEDLRISISQERVFNDSMKRRFEQIRSNKAKWYRNTALITLSLRQRYKIFNEVNLQAPVRRFFVPEDK